MIKISYSDFQQQDFIPFLEMAKKLWKDFDRKDLEQLLMQTIESKKYRILIAKNQDKRCVAFSIFSIRSDYVEGAVKSPTGYLEGIFVDSEFRKTGIAREFLRLGESWCKEKGCSQMGSDTWLTDIESRKFHKKVGFREEEEVVHFLKDIE